MTVPEYNDFQVQPVPDELVPPGRGDDVPNHQATSDIGPPDQDANKVNEPKRSLGEGTKRGSKVRQLTKKDLDGLHSMYASLGFTLSMVHPAGGQAIGENAENCVERWAELAKQNDSVRKGILAMLEGGAWGGVVAAHLPIVLAFVPQKTLERMPMLFNPNMNGDVPEDESVEYAE